MVWLFSSEIFFENYENRSEKSSQCSGKYNSLAFPKRFLQLVSQTFHPLAKNLFREIFLMVRPPLNSNLLNMTEAYFDARRQLVFPSTHMLTREKRGRVMILAYS